MTNVFVLALAYRNSTEVETGSIQQDISSSMREAIGSSRLEVRIGYFGICVRQNGVVWLCSSDAQGLAEQIGSDNDPLNLIKAAAKFKDGVIFSGIILLAVSLSFVALILLATFPGWHEGRDERTGSDVEVKSFPWHNILRLSLAFAFSASVLLLMASLWQHVGCVGAAEMADIAYYSSVQTEVGAAAMGMTWAGFGLSTMVSIGLTTMIISIAVLANSTNA